MKVCFKLKTSLLILLMTGPSLALVDYTDQEEFRPKNSGARSLKAPVKKSVQTITRKRSPKSGPSAFEFLMNYESLSIDLENQGGKVGMMNFKGRIQTQYNLFLELSYWQAESATDSLAQDSSWQKGNPELVLGLNWLQFGTKQDAATVDLYGGLNLGQKGADFASQRTDKIVGITTAKRFYEFALGLGYELRVSGRSKNESEMDIGNIMKLGASLGWEVSSDIRMLLEAATYTVGKSSDETRDLRLEEKVKFSTLNPKLQLMISPMINLELGAVFRSRRIKSGNLIAGKLWNIKGAYGNSIYAGLGATY